MEKKNMILLTVIAVATLLVAVVGATFAYFTATIDDQRGGEETDGQAAITAAQTPGSLTIEKNTNGFESFNTTDVYPGHKDLIKLKITSSSQDVDTYFNIVYEGQNSFPENTIKFTLYESNEDLTLEDKKAFTCIKKSEKTNEELENQEKYKLYEECTLDQSLTTTNAHSLGDIYPTNNKKTVLNGDHPFVITKGEGSPKSLYYYIVVEYVNKPSTDQNEGEQGKTLSGNISIEIAPRDESAISDTDPGKLTTKTT